ncbi:MAG: tRNA dihydrouridine(20/20a) synthase DusA [Pseudomonadales bacterium]
MVVNKQNNPRKRGLQQDRTLCVAPMMAWTDRHCRYLHRLAAPRALLFTEMVTANALHHGNPESLLRFDPAEHPVALQLGGSEPELLAAAADMAAKAGFDEVNLNVGCPSPRVQRGRFGACLMLEPELVRDCVVAMAERVRVPVTVKCRLGVDDADSDELIDRFIGTVAESGCRTFYLHARKALLSGLSPAQNRSVPPLQHQRVHALKSRFPSLQIIINGGIDAAEALDGHLAAVDGVMVGRAAYHAPMTLAAMHARVFGGQAPDRGTIMARYQEYVRRELDQGTRLADMTRHVLGLFGGVPGARRFRRTLSDARALAGNDIALLDRALAELRPRTAAA